MKSITKMLEKSNLTARERIITLIKNRIYEDRTGKSILNNADKESLSRGGTDYTQRDVNDYNKYIYLWKTFDLLQIDMQLLMGSVQLEFANFEKILLLYHYRKNPAHIERVLDNQYSEECEKGIDFIIENTGLDHERVLHRLTFLELPRKIQNDLINIDYYSQWEPEYLNQEEQLSEILKDKKELSNGDVTVLTDLIISSLSWDREEKMNLHKLNFSDLIFNGHFGGYPIINFGIKLAEKYNISFENTSDLKNKLSQVSNLKNKLEDIVYESIKEGLFFDEYIPLCNSENHETYTEKIKLQHKEIFRLWIETKRKIEKKMEKIIENNRLVVEERTEKILDMNYTKTIITGTSLYYAKSSIDFIDKYKKQADSLRIYGSLFNLLAEQEFPKKYGYILAYQDIVSEVSKIVGMKAVNTDTEYLKQIELLSSDVNKLLVSIADNVTEFIYSDSNRNFHIETFFENYNVHLEKAKPVKITPHKLFIQEAKSLLGLEWQH